MLDATCSIILLQSEANASEVLPRMGVTLAACRMPHAACHNWPHSLCSNAATTLLNLHNFRSAFSRFSALLRCCSALSFAPPSCQLIIKLATETFTKHLAKNAHLPETCADCVMRRRDAGQGEGAAGGDGATQRVVALLSHLLVPVPALANAIKGPRLPPPI